MPYSGVSETRKRVPSLKNLSTEQVRKFIEVANALLESGMAEDKAIPLAIAQAKKVKKSVSKAKDNNRDKTIPVIKELHEEEMIAVEWLYCSPLEGDAHEDGMTETEIRKMVDSFNTNINKISGNIAHFKNVSDIQPLKAWVNECDCYIGDQLVPEGTPIVKVKFHDQHKWELRKSGVLMGVSIGARGNRVPNPDYIEPDEEKN